MIRSILTEPNPTLRKRSAEVETSELGSSAVKEVISDLIETLAVSEDGIGIAAPQIAISLRIFIISEEAKYIDAPADKRPKKEKKEWKNLIYINPVVSGFSKRKVEGAEGCLSVPKKFGIVPRHEKLRVSAYDENGVKFSRGASKFLARVIQHELDHLDGVLFIDRALRFIEPKNLNEKL